MECLKNSISNPFWFLVASDFCPVDFCVIDPYNLGCLLIWHRMFYFLSAVDICQIGLVTSRPLQILFMFTVDKYPRYWYGNL